MLAPAIVAWQQRCLHLQLQMCGRAIQLVVCKQDCHASAGGCVCYMLGCSRKALF